MAAVLGEPDGRDLWCSSYAAAVPLSPLASKPLVDDINAALAPRCR